jgi:methylated-DNA-[protein]-cysteine S-methyltransferase
MKNRAAETRAAERIALGAFAELTGRTGEPVRYAMMTDTPVGTLGLAAGAAGVCRISYVRGEDDFLKALLGDFGDRPVLRSDELDTTRRTLDRYFRGRRLDFEDLLVDLSGVSGFSRRVLEETARIPIGSFLTYAQIAARAGSPKATRAAGNALHNNPIPIVVPCHRVLRSGGKLGGYGGGSERKEWLLQHEGATLI